MGIFYVLGNRVLPGRDIMKVGDLVKIRHDSSTLGLVIAVGDGTPESDRHPVLEGSPITYRVWVSWNHLDAGVNSWWNWQLESIQ